MSITLSAKAQLFGKDWVAGSYTDSSGKVFSGLLYSSVSDPYSLKIKGDYLQYKIDKDAEKQKIPTWQIKSFVIGTDSFAVSHFVSLKNFPFLQIIISHQNKLYYSAYNPTILSTAGAALVGGAIGAAAFNSKGSAYYYGSDPDHITLLKGKMPDGID
ncbi:MAG: hypothetical protein EOP41_09520 [Sphingobacteriaceae bacterium]|nr:MAG: hypothetical protein EOP41_09520 [Sphingobacteriaceae bacterium]